jgi:hypothetical protein
VIYLAAAVGIPASDVGDSSSGRSAPVMTATVSLMLI